MEGRRRRKVKRQEFTPMTWGKLPSTLEESSGRRNESIHQVLEECLRPCVAGSDIGSKSSGKFTREPPPFGTVSDVEWLDPKRISRQHDSAAFSSTIPLIKKCQREDPVELPEEGRTPLFPTVDEDLGIRPGAEPMTGPLQLMPQRDVIVDLTVVSDPDILTLVCHRLSAAFEIEDAQSPVAQGDGSTAEKGEAVAIGPPMRQFRAQAPDRIRDVPAGGMSDQSSNPAHPSHPSHSVLPKAFGNH